MNRFPYEIEDVDDEWVEEMATNLVGKFVLVGPQKFLLSAQYRNFAERYYNFQVRSSDVFVTGFPRSGTTMTEELAWLLVNDLDIEKSIRLGGTGKKVYYFDVDSMVMPQPWPKVLSDKFIPFNEFDGIPDPRVFKSHLSLCLLPPNLLTCGCKVIYVARNPKDVIVSLFHFLKRMPGNALRCNFETFANYFVDNKRLVFQMFPISTVNYTPFWTLLEHYWQNRTAPNLLFVFYEDMIKDPKDSIRQLATFLIGRDLTAEEVDRLADHIKFDNFKKSMKSQDYLAKTGDENDGFARKGAFGQSQAYFQGELKIKVDKWIRENVERIGIKYPHLD